MKKAAVETAAEKLKRFIGTNIVHCFRIDKFIFQNLFYLFYEKYVYYCGMEIKELTPVHIRIREAMDGRKNIWLQEKLAERGIELTPPQLSQRLNGNVNFTGDEAIVVFDILGINIREEQ